MIEPVPCVICGRALRSPKSIERGYGDTCAGKAPEHNLMLLKGEPGAVPLFPEIDAPLIAAAEQEVKDTYAKRDESALADALSRGAGGA